MSTAGGKTKAKGNLRTSFIDPDLATALSHPLRVHILDVLSEVTASPSDLARDAGLSVNHVAYHVKELEKIGFVELVKTVPRRGTVEHYYRTKRRKLLFDDDKWEQVPSPVRLGLSADALRIMIEGAKKALASGTIDARSGHLSSTSLLVDEQGWEEVMTALNQILDRLLLLQTECVERLEASGEEPIPISVSLAGFELPPKSEADASAVE